MKKRIQAGALEWLDITNDPEGEWIQTNVPWGPRNLRVEHHNDNSLVVDIPFGGDFQVSSHIDRAGRFVLEIEAHEGDNAVVRLIFENEEDLIRVRSGVAGARVPKVDPRSLPEVGVLPADTELHFDPGFVDEPPVVGLEQLTRDFVFSFKNVFGHDWFYTKAALHIPDKNGSVDPRGTFLDPGVDDESNDWANRGALLFRYRNLLSFLDDLTARRNSTPATKSKKK